MFTPQNKIFSRWLSPHKNNNGDGSAADGSPDPNEEGQIVVSSKGKGKGIAFLESTPPTMEREVAVDKISKLENELFEYQYNMGLLLIEKKEWASNYEKIQQALAEAKESLRREQTAHLIAISEVEKREEKLRKALGVEKQCVLELEKALRDMRSECAEMKFTSDSKLDEANALAASIEGKSMEVEAKLRALDAKLAEVSRKTSEIERKSLEVDARESSLRRERAAFNAERDAHERNLSNQKEDLRQWERKLQDGEERLDEVRRLLNQREERANENDRVFKQKLIDIEDEQKKIDVANSDLKNKEDDISSRIGSLTLKEQELDAIRNKLELEEKKLQELEAKLNAREQVEIQKLLDEHKMKLDAKKCEFDLELEQKEKLLDEDFKRKIAEVEKKEAEVSHLEGKIAKREQALEKKIEKSDAKEKDLDSKSKALKEREKSLKAEEKKLESERRQLSSEKENLLSLKVEHEQLMADIEAQQLKVNEERERLRVTEEERAEHVRLQSELKQERDKCIQERSLLLKEREELKSERQMFEKEWEELDDKRAKIKKELESIAEEKAKFEKLKWSEEEKLNNQRLETKCYVERELEALKLAKESFDASIKHEKSVIDENYENEKSRLHNDFELRKQELETEMQRKEAEMENDFRERLTSFKEEKDRELKNIEFLKEVASREMEEMKQERKRLEKERHDIFANQKHIEGQQLEMRKDIDELVGLSMKLKEQREQFLKERERFIAFVEKLKDYENCGDMISEFVRSDLQSLGDVNDAENFTLPKLADDYLKEAIEGTSGRSNGETSQGVANTGSPASGRTLSWLKKCTSRIFIFSPGKKNELETAQNRTGAANLHEKLAGIEETPRNLLSFEDDEEVSIRVAADSFDIQRVQSDHSMRELEATLDLSVNDQSNVNSKAYDIEEVTQQPDKNEGLSKPSKRNKARVYKKRSSKAVVGDPTNVLGNASEYNESEHGNDIAEDSVYTNEENREDANVVGEGSKANGRKRTRSRDSRRTTSEQDPDYSEGDSVTTGSRRKRRQKVVPVLETLQERRYNLRRSKIAASVGTNGAVPKPINEKGKEVDGIGNKQAETDSNALSTPFTQNKIGAGTGDEDADVADKFVHDMVLSEEVNGTPEPDREHGNNEHRNETPGVEEEGENEHGEDDEVEHPGEVSIGRKLWTFIST